MTCDKVWTSVAQLRAEVVRLRKMIKHPPQGQFRAIEYRIKDVEDSFCDFECSWPEHVKSHHANVLSE